MKLGWVVGNRGVFLNKEILGCFSIPQKGKKLDLTDLQSLSKSLRPDVFQNSQFWGVSITGWYIPSVI